jgi:hypothetical protein
MAMNRRAAVVKKLLDNAGYTGDLTRLAESLPPQTIAQFDKLLNHKEPSVGPGMDSGIVVAYKSGEVVQDRPMQGNFSKEGIAVYEAGGYVPSPKDKPRSPVGQELYGLGDVEYRAELDPQFTNVVATRDGMEDDYVGLLGLRALEQKYGGDYGKFIDADARKRGERPEHMDIRGYYKADSDQINVKTTPTDKQRLAALKDPEGYNAYFSKEAVASTTAHELFHAGNERLDTPRALWLEHTILEPLGWERFNKTEASRNVANVLKRYYPEYPAYQEEPPNVSGMWRSNHRRMQDEAREKYEALGPRRVKLGDGSPEEPGFFRSIINRFEDGGAVEPRSVDSEAEILAIYDLLDEENQKPERERDPERINELYSRLTELRAMSAPPVALELSEDVYLRPQFDARGGISESNWRVPFGPDNTVKIRDRNMGGIARLGAEIGFPGFSGNDRISGGVTATYDRTKRLLPDEFIAFGAPSDIRFGPRGVVPRGYDVSYSSGPHTFSGNVTPRQEGVDPDAQGGRSVLGLGYTHSTPKATYSLQATPFGVRENPDPKTGAAKMVRPFRAGVTIPF